MSAAVLDEVERTLLQDFAHIDPEGLRRRVGYMRAALVDHAIDTTGADVPDSVTRRTDTSSEPPSPVRRSSW